MIPAIATACSPPMRSARTPPPNAASAPAAARPIPRTPTTRPRSRAGYMAPHRRRWNGPPKERLSQKTIATPTTTGAGGTMNRMRSEAAPRPRMRLSWAVFRGPSRPAKAPRKLATNGAAVRAASPIGSRPPRRATVGRIAPTRAIVTPMPTATTRSRARFRPIARRDAEARSDGRITEYLEAARSACEVSCRARRGFAVAVVRDLPQGVGSPVLIEEVRPLQTIPVVMDQCDGPIVPGPTWPIGDHRLQSASVPDGTDLWGCVDSTGLGYRGTRAEDAAQASLIRQQNEVPGN